MVYVGAGLHRKFLDHAALGSDTLRGGGQLRLDGDDLGDERQATQ